MKAGSSVFSNASAISIARSPLATLVGPWAPPLTVGSLALMTHSTPRMRPMPLTMPPPSGSSVA